MWNRSNAAGNGDRPNHELGRLVQVGQGRPGHPGQHGRPAIGRGRRGERAHHGQADQPVGHGYPQEPARLPHLPQCGTASRTKCDATPTAKAGSGRRASAPISAPDKT